MRILRMQQGSLLMCHSGLIVILLRLLRILFGAMFAACLMAGAPRLHTLALLIYKSYAYAAQGATS